MFPLIERIFDTIVHAIGEAGGHFVALLRELDSTDGPVPVPGMTWTVAETAVHMGNIVRRGTGDRRRADSLPGLAELNDLCIAETEPRDVHEIADDIERELARLVQSLGHIGAERASATTVQLHAGLVADLPSALSYVLFDFLAHGLDIARATGRKWEIDPSFAALDLHAALPILDPWVKDTVLAGPRQRIVLGFAGDPYAIEIEVGNGEYRAGNVARDAAGSVEEVDPVHAFLAVAGREPARTPPVARLAALFEPI